MYGTLPNSSRSQDRAAQFVDMIEAGALGNGVHGDDDADAFEDAEEDEGDFEDAE